MTATRIRPEGAVLHVEPPVSPVLTVADLDRLGAESVTALARLVFRARHRQYDQYDGYLEQQHETALLRVTRDPSPAAGTFSRYEVGDVVIGWRGKYVGWGPFPGWVAYCPRVGWNVQMPPGHFEVIA